MASSMNTTWSHPDRDDISDTMQPGDVIPDRTYQEDSEESEVFLSVMWSGGKLGAAFYDSSTAEINMLKDTVETENFHILHKVWQQVEPKHVVASTKSDERFLAALGELGDVSPTCNTMFKTADPVSVEFLPSIEFSLEVCKRRVMSIEMPAIPEHYSEADRTIFLSSAIPLDSACLVRALGGLLKFLEKRRVGVELEPSDSGVPILSLRTFQLQDVMFVDMDTYVALQLFKNESHPSAYKSSGAKEGLSLFGVLNRTRSVIGSKLMRIWFMQPSRDIGVLKKRLEAVTFFVNPKNAEVTSSLQDALKQIKNVPRILKLMQQAQASISDWQTLYKTAYSAMNIGDICRAQNALDIHIFKKIGEAFTEDLHYIANFISKIVDFDESLAVGKFVVQPNVDPDLDKRKRTYNGLPALMTQVARQELDKLQEDIEECNVIYLPQLGYLLAIPCTQEMSQTRQYEIPGLEFVFLNNNIVHYKSDSTKALDTRLGDTQCEITDHETQIMHRLQDAILEKADVFFAVMEYAAELDCLLAFAAAAKDYSYVCPQLTQDNTIDIQAGRHPLQEMCVTTFVPNDTLSSRQNGKMKFLTGPNASGKSVYLKQVGVISFMAHIGSFVPAERATIGMLDGIYTRIHTEESISVGLSTFMIDLNQMATALGCATASSLVIIDEFGKGTDVADGTSLLVAVLKYWLAFEDQCPHLFIATHFHSVLKQDLLPQSKQLKCQTMDVIDSDGEMVFLYQLTDGHASYSYASHVSSMAGLPDEIVQRGKQYDVKIVDFPLSMPESTEGRFWINSVPYFLQNTCSMLQIRMLYHSEDDMNPQAEGYRREVSELIKQNKPVARVAQASADSQLKEYKQITDQFMESDVECLDLQQFFRDVMSVVEGTERASSS